MIRLESRGESVVAEAKTQPTAVSVADHVAAIDDPARRADCQALIQLMRRLTGAEPVMWGPGIVGFGRYQYRYASGHSGEWPLTGFASRKGDLSIYLVAEGARQAERLSGLGRHRMGKACLYVKRLADVDLAVLEQLIEASVAEVRRRYPD